MSWFVATTGYSFLDWWSLVHVCFWVFIGSVLWSCRLQVIPAVLAGLFWAYLWEVVERHLERAYPSLWLDPESWWNSWISDPLMCVIGIVGIWYALEYRRRRKDANDSTGLHSV